MSATAIVVLPRKSSRSNHFLNQANWLLLAPEARFRSWQGQSWEQLSQAVDRIGIAMQSSNSMRI
jgi:hypothetical protein